MLKVEIETTRKGIDQRRKDLYARTRQKLSDIGDREPTNLARDLRGILPDNDYDNYRRETEELNCIDMIHSILTYSDPSTWTVDDIMENRYIKKYIDILGKIRVATLIQKEIAEYMDVEITKDTYIDSEGVAYNSVRFKDDI